MSSNETKNRDTLICIDQESLRHLYRTKFGLASFDTFPLVQVVTSAEEARTVFRSHDHFTCAFIFSSDEMPPLNVAAALKSDNPHKRVFVVSDESDEYFLQRCTYAQVDEVVAPGLLEQRLMPPVRSVSSAPLPLPEPLVQPPAFGCLAALGADAPQTIQLHPRCTFVPVVSASGGTGKSTVSFLSAYITARLGYKTLLIDFDAQLGDLSHFMNEEPQLTLTDVLNNPDGARGLKAGALGFSFVGACSTLVEAEDVQNHLSEILATVSAQYDVVIANCPVLWNDQLIILLERAAKIFFLLDQRPTSLKTAQRAFDVCLNCGLATSPFVFLLNRCGKSAQVSTIDVGFALKGSAAWELHEAGKEVSEYLMAGQVDYLRQDKNALYMDVEALLLETLPQSDVLKGIQKNARPAGLFSFLFKNRGAACL